MTDDKGHPLIHDLYVKILRHMGGRTSQWGKVVCIQGDMAHVVVGEHEGCIVLTSKELRAFRNDEAFERFAKADRERIRASKEAV